MKMGGFMDSFIESDEIERIKNEKDEIYKRLRSLFTLEASAKMDDSINLDEVNEEINVLKNRYREIIFTLKQADARMENENDRYKANKRK